MVKGLYIILVQWAYLTAVRVCQWVKIKQNCVTSVYLRSLT